MTDFIPRHYIIEQFHELMCSLSRHNEACALEQQTLELAKRYDLSDYGITNRREWSTEVNRLAEVLSKRPCALRRKDIMNEVAGLVKVFGDDASVMKLFDACILATTKPPEPYAFYQLKDAAGSNMNEIMNGKVSEVTARQVNVRRAVEAIETRWPELDAEAQALKSVITTHREARHARRYGSQPQGMA